MRCRSCHECKGYQHHWITNGGFGDFSQPPAVRDHSHTCKHCNAMGDECETCGGEGAEPDLETASCRDCLGEGVIFAGWFDREASLNA